MIAGDGDKSFNLSLGAAAIAGNVVDKGEIQVCLQVVWRESDR
jgi:hypothetical protein